MFFIFVTSYNLMSIQGDPNIKLQFLKACRLFIEHRTEGYLSKKKKKTEQD